MEEIKEKKKKANRLTKKVNEVIPNTKDDLFNSPHQ
jgi:hypothetical protein